LSYTDFKYGNLRITPPQIYQGGNAVVSIDVTNVGNRTGVEVPQLYVHERYAPVSLPIKQLRGFDRVSLTPGETKTVTMKLTPEALMLLDRDMHWTVVPGSFDLMIGKSSGDIVLRGFLEVKSADALTGEGFGR
jgi:beta-glucosidase